IIKILQRYNINYEVINTSSMKINEVHQSSKKFFDSYTKPKMKSNNSIVIGGMIASGKSSLGKNIAEFFEAEFIDELDWDDPLTNLSLDKLYSENLVTPLTTQIFFLMNRIERYKKNETTKQLKIHDRSILEDLIFSEPVIKNDKEHLRFFENLLRKEINKLFIESGVPKLYIFLKVGWKNFRQRIINRGRSNEIHDFPKKEKYFKKIIDRYNNLFEKILLTYNMRYIIIDTDDKTKKTVFKESIKAIKKSIGNPNYETKEIEINYKKQNKINKNYFL
ncbi:MAG: deoxynucleoside kinase, partial [Mollicutes bacterium PWAP]|nr:deoxynucleoside kinase [Mollicutes bacterium PWAP]